MSNGAECVDCERCTWNPGPDCGRPEHEHCDRCGHCRGRHTGVTDVEWSGTTLPAPTRRPSILTGVMTSLTQDAIDDAVRAHLATARQLIPTSGGNPIRPSSGFGAQAARIEVVDGVPTVVGEWVAREIVGVVSIDVTVEALDEPFYTVTVDQIFAAGDSYRLTIPLA